MTLKNYCLGLFLLLSLFSCQQEEPKKPDTPPLTFEITSTADVQNSEYVLTWTEAKSSNGNPVTYTVVYGDTLVRDIAKTTFTLKNLPYEEGTIIASDGRGGKTERTFKVKVPENYTVLIPDKLFEQYLVDHGIDNAIDGKVLFSRVLNVKEMDLSGYLITDLEGLQNFRNLHLLVLSRLAIREVKLTGLRRLRELTIFLCEKLENLDFSDANDLEQISINRSLIKQVNIKNLVYLKQIHLWDNKNLEFLDVSNNLKLENFQLSYGNVRMLDLSKNAGLLELGVAYNPLESLNLLNNPKLRNISVDSKELTSLTLPSVNHELRSLVLSSENMNGIDFFRFENLEELALVGVELNTFDGSRLPALTKLSLQRNKMSEINLLKNNKLTSLWIINNSLEGLDLSGCNDLKLLAVNKTRLKELKLCDQPQLYDLSTSLNDDLMSIYVRDLSQVSMRWTKDNHTAFKVCN